MAAPVASDNGPLPPFQTPPSLPEPGAPILEHALFLASLGLRVHPLHHIQSDGVSCSCLLHDGFDPVTKEPVYCRLGNRSAGKHPRLKAWPERASNEETAVRGLFGYRSPKSRVNLAVATGVGSRVLVVDVDPKNGGQETLDLLEARYGKLPDTWQTLTASGGLHSWFRYPDLPPGIAIGNVNSTADGGLLGPGLDIRAEGGYVVVPPSCRGVLGAYCWELSSVPGEVPLADCPRWLVDLLLSTRSSDIPTTRQPDAAYPPADIVSIEAGCAWLRRCRDEAPLIGQWEWRLALSIWGRCGEGEALAHQRSQLDPRRYTREATAEQLRHALGRAGPVRCARVETDPGIRYPGCATCPHHKRIVSPILLGRQTPQTRAYADRAVPPPPRADASSAREPGPPPDDGAPPPPPEEAPEEAPRQKKRRERRRLPVVMTARELLAKVFPAPRDVLPEVVPEGLTLLVGRSKLGKSILMVQGAVAVVSGGPLFGKPTEVPIGRVLYLDLENGERRAQERVDELLAVTGEDDTRQDRLHVSSFWPGWEEGGLEYLEAWMEKYPDTRLIVIDTLKRVRPGEAGNKRLYDLDYDALAPLADLAHRHTIAVVVIHHTRKADASDILDMASGSTGLVAAVDAVLIWRRRRGHPEARLYLADRDRGEVQHQFLWSAHLQGWAWTGTQTGDTDGEGADGVSPPEGGGDVRGAVLRVLVDTAMPLAPAELAAYLHKNGNAVRVQLFRMAKAGDVRHVTTRETPQGPESGSFYALPVPEAAAEDGDAVPHSACNGVMASLFDSPYQEGEGVETPITSPPLHSRILECNGPNVMPQTGPLPEKEASPGGPPLHITFDSGVRGGRDDD